MTTPPYLVFLVRVSSAESVLLNSSMTCSSSTWVISSSGIVAAANLFNTGHKCCPRRHTCNRLTTSLTSRQQGAWSGWLETLDLWIMWPGGAARIYKPCILGVLQIETAFDHSFSIGNIIFSADYWQCFTLTWQTHHWKVSLDSMPIHYHIFFWANCLEYYGNNHRKQKIHTINRYCGHVFWNWQTIIKHHTWLPI